MPITDFQIEQRRKHLGSSDSPALFANAYDLYLKKTGQVPDFEGNTATIVGRMVEDGVLDWAAEQLELKIIKNQYRVGDNGIHSANLDAITADNSVIFEAKTTGLLGPVPDADQWGDEYTDQVPERVLIQVAHQFYVLRAATTTYVPALIGGRGPVIFKIMRNDRLVQAVIAEGEKFWNNHVIPRVAPDCIPTLDIVKKVRREPNKTVNIPADMLAVYEEAAANLKLADDAKSVAQATILAALGDAEAGTCDNGRSVTYFQQSHAGIDTKRLKEDLPEITSKYTKDSTFRVLRIKEPPKKKGSK